MIREVENTHVFGFCVLEKKLPDHCDAKCGTAQFFTPSTFYFEKLVFIDQKFRYI